jgi:hypothetical protein
MSLCENWDKYSSVKFRNIDCRVVPLPEIFGIVSPLNPFGKEGSIDNPFSLLCKKYKESHIGWIDGYSDTTDHTERSAIFQLSEKECLDIGCIWKQDAIFYIRCNYLVLIHETGQEKPLGNFTKRIV